MKNHIFGRKNVIFERFQPISECHFAACTTLVVTYFCICLHDGRAVPWVAEFLQGLMVDGDEWNVPTYLTDVSHSIWLSYTREGGGRIFSQDGK